MRSVMIVDARDYKKVIAKLRDALDSPHECDKLIREALAILTKRD